MAQIFRWNKHGKISILIFPKIAFAICESSMESEVMSLRSKTHQGMYNLSIK